jgi:hypothetical protein
MSDLFPKNNRFLVTGPFDDEMPYHYIIIRDYTWWQQNEGKIYKWMNECLPKGHRHQQGMVIVIENESDVSNFLLRWQT